MKILVYATTYLSLLALSVSTVATARIDDTGLQPSDQGAGRTVEVIQSSEVFGPPYTPEEQIDETELPETEPIIDLTEPEVESIDISEEETKLWITQSDIELIAKVTMAEAEGEPEEGKRLVIDTILNRVESEYFPDTVYEVIYAPDQFTSMWNGRIDVCYVMDDIVQLVHEELENRVNRDVVFFTTESFVPYGTPEIQVGNHYFASLGWKE